jgi:hypothetical protein
MMQAYLKLVFKRMFKLLPVFCKKIVMKNDNKFVILIYSILCLKIQYVLTEKKVDF